MHILTVLKPIKLQGEILLPGEMFKAIDSQLLIDRGYARRLNRDETKVILDGYIRFAERIFNKNEVLKKSQVGYIQGALIISNTTDIQNKKGGCMR